MAISNLTAGVYIVKPESQKLFKDTAAGSYTSVFTKNREDEWQLALTQASQESKSAQASYEAQLEAYTKRLKDIDDSIEKIQTKRVDAATHIAEQRLKRDKAESDFAIKKAETMSLSGAAGSSGWSTSNGGSGSGSGRSSGKVDANYAYWKGREDPNTSKAELKALAAAAISQADDTSGGRFAMKAIKADQESIDSGASVPAERAKEAATGVASDEEARKNLKIAPGAAIPDQAAYDAEIKRLADLHAIPQASGPSVGSTGTVGSWDKQSRRDSWKNPSEQVLKYPSLVEYTGQTSAQLDTESEKELAAIDAELARLQGLSGTVPVPQLDAARGDLITRARELMHGRFGSTLLTERSPFMQRNALDTLVHSDPAFLEQLLKKYREGGGGTGGNDAGAIDIIESGKFGDRERSRMVRGLSDGVEAMHQDSSSKSEAPSLDDILVGRSTTKDSELIRNLQGIPTAPGVSQSGAFGDKKQLYPLPFALSVDGHPLSDSSYNGNIGSKQDGDINVLGESVPARRSLGDILLNGYRSYPEITPSQKDEAIAQFEEKARGTQARVFPSSEGRDQPRSVNGTSFGPAINTPYNPSGWSPGLQHESLGVDPDLAALGINAPWRGRTELSPNVILPRNYPPDNMVERTTAHPYIAPSADISLGEKQFGSDQSAVQTSTPLSVKETRFGQYEPVASKQLITTSPASEKANALVSAVGKKGDYDVASKALGAPVLKNPPKEKSKSTYLVNRLEEAYILAGKPSQLDRKTKSGAGKVAKDIYSGNLSKNLPFSRTWDEITITFAGDDAAMKSAHEAALALDILATKSKEAKE